MAIVQLNQFDIAVAQPYHFATGGFWAGLPRMCRGAPVVKLLIISDKLRGEDITRGFRQRAAPENSLPSGVRAYRMQYEEFLETQVSQEMRFLRAYLVMDTSLDDEGLVRLLGSYGLSARVPEGEVPQPFSNGAIDWDTVVSDDGQYQYWSMLQSTAQQHGSIFPRTLHRLFKLEFPVWVALTIYTYPQASANQLLRRKSISARYDKSEGDGAVEAQEVGNTVRAVSHEMHRYGSALHTIQLYVLVGADSKEEISARRDVLRGAVPVEMRTAPADKIATVFSTDLPPDSSGAFLTSPGVSILTGSALSFRRRTETRGVMMGMDRNQAPVIFDIFDESNASYNCVVLGQTGSGKTFAVLLSMMRHLLLGARSIIVDPQGNINLSFLGEDVCHRSVIGTSEASINILDITRDELMKQVSSVKHILRMLSVLPEDNGLDDAVLDEVLVDIYAPLWGKDVPVPTLGAVRKRLEQQASNAHSPTVQASAAGLANRLAPYTEGSLAALFGRRTTVDFSLDAFVNIFDVSRLPDQTTGGNLRAALLGILVADINQSIRRRRAAGDVAPIIFFIDEFGILTRDPVVAAYTSSEYKTARSRLVGMIVADQDLHSMLGPADPVSGVHHGIPILANAATTLIFKQRGSELTGIRDHFPDIPGLLIDKLPTLGLGSCIAQLPNDLLTVQVMPSPLEKIILSSRLQDRRRAREVIEQLIREIG